MLPPRNSIGFNLIELQQVESTNNYATGLAHAGMAQHGTVVWSHHQTAGKGQRHKSWETDAGENITASFILEPSWISLPNAFGLSRAVAVGVQRFFATYAGEQTKVKWPNDLYWGDRKAGGILIENILSGAQWKYAIVGIGININQTVFGGLAQKAVSLKQITGASHDIPPLIKELCRHLEQALTELESNPISVEGSYHELLYKIGERVRLKKGGRVFEATIKGVSPQGRLIAHHLIDETFEVGEVEWVIS